MKIGILTDSHDQIDNLSKALNYLEQQNVKTGLLVGIIKINE
jgi:predicted phosphodiesterase